MTAHVRRVESLLSPTGLWDAGFQFGDWLDPTAPPDEPACSKADNGVVATACLYRDARILAETASLLGRGEDAAALRRSRRAHPKPHSTSTTSTMTAPSTVMRRRRTRWPSSSACLIEETAQLAGKRLAELVAESGYHIQTGFAGTPYVLDALSTTGHLDEAYRLLLQTRMPVLALPGHDGRDDDLGALGLDAARRHHQSRPDDELQPLRPRRRRGLDASQHRRHRAARARLLQGVDRAPAGW